MRNIAVQMYVSLDGVVAAPDDHVIALRRGDRGELAREPRLADPGRPDDPQRSARILGGRRFEGTPERPQLAASAEQPVPPTLASEPS